MQQRKSGSFRNFLRSLQSSLFTLVKAYRIWKNYLLQNSISVEKLFFCKAAYQKGNYVLQSGISAGKLFFVKQHISREIIFCKAAYQQGNYFLQSGISAEQLFLQNGLSSEKI